MYSANVECTGKRRYYGKHNESSISISCKNVSKNCKCKHVYGMRHRASFMRDSENASIGMRETPLTVITYWNVCSKVSLVWSLHQHAVMQLNKKKTCLPITPVRTHKDQSEWIGSVYPKWLKYSLATILYLYGLFKAFCLLLLIYGSYPRKLHGLQNCAWVRYHACKTS